MELCHTENVQKKIVWNGQGDGPDHNWSGKWAGSQTFP